MGLVIILSNYLVQFPIKKFNLENILTYGAFSYPITFLITDLANRSFGKEIAKKLVYFGFLFGIFLTLVISTNFKDLISIRIAIGSGTAFLIAQLIDIQIFQRYRDKIWFLAPITSSICGSIIDTFLFFSISFLGTGIPWISLAFGIQHTRIRTHTYALALSLSLFRARKRSLSHAPPLSLARAHDLSI